MSFAPIQLLQSAVNKNVWAFLDNEHDKYISAAFYLGAATTLPLNTELFGQTCMLFHKIERNIYLNLAADGATPNWQLIAGASVPVFPFLLNKGDLLTHNGTQAVILPVGPNGYLLTADSSQPDGIKWAPLSNTPPSIIFTSGGTTGFIQQPSLTWSHTVSGLNRLLVVEVQTEEVQTITSVTYNGVALTQIPGSVVVDVANNLRSEHWFLIAPPIGTFNIVVSMSAPAYISGQAETLVNVDQLTPIGADQTSSGSSANASLILPTVYDYSLVIDSLCVQGPGITFTAGAGQTVNNQQIIATREGISTVQAAGTAPDNIAMDVAISPATDWVYGAIEIKGQNAGITTDEKVKVSSGDTLADFLFNKVSAGSGINLSILNPGGVEQLLITATGSGAGALQIDQTPDNGSYGLLAGAVDGVNTTFIVSTGVYASGKLTVFLNGIIQQQGVSDDWVETNPVTGTFDFVVAPLPGDIITAVYQSSGGGGGSGTDLSTSVNQVAHGLSVGDVIQSNGVDNEFTQAQANNVNNSEAVGIVTAVIDADNFTYTSSAIQLSGGFVPVGTPGDAIFLDPFVPGGLTTTKPTTIGHVVRGLGTILASGTKMYFDISALAEEITAASGGNFNVTNVTAFDDFVAFITVPEDGSNPDESGVSGNFQIVRLATSTISIGNIISEVDHPGIIRLADDTDGFYGFGANVSPGASPAKGLLSAANDFDITFLTRFDYSANTYELNVGMNEPGGAGEISFNVNSGVISYTPGSGAPIVTAIPVPASGTWFEIRLQYVSGILTMIFNGSTAYSSPTVLSGFHNVYGFLVDDTGLNGYDTDYVITNYQVTR